MSPARKPQARRRGKPKHDVNYAVRTARSGLEMPDASVLYAPMAAAATVGMESDPLWVLIVGGSSGGKTEVLNALGNGLVDKYMSEFTVPGLLSVTKGENAIPTGLLARHLGQKILVVVRDLSAILALEDRGRRREELAKLREMYDGYVAREIYGHKLEWKGRATMIGAVTHAIDRFAAHNEELGTRWLSLRLPDANIEAQRRIIKKVEKRKGADRDSWRHALRSVVEHVVTRAQDRLEKEPERYEATGRTSKQIERYSIVGARGRASVPRSGYGAREQIGMPDIEGPARLHGELLLLYQGARAIGLTEERALKLARRMAKDSMPRQRATALHALAQTDGFGVSASGASRRYGIDRKVIAWALEDLGAAGMARSERATDEQGTPVYWMPDPEYSTYIKATFK
ncbi:MAG: hypothetical protein ACRDMH_13205 [Solirubrobacterales bacterium]